MTNIVRTMKKKRITKKDMTVGEMLYEVNAPGLRDRSISECLACTAEKCKGCPKSYEETHGGRKPPKKGVTV